MSSPDISKELANTAYEAGQAALREAVIAVGGVEGVFRELREDPRAAFDKYGMLLKVSTSPEQQSKNKTAYMEIEKESTLEERVAGLAMECDVSMKDATLLYFAAGVVIKAGLEQEE